MADVYVRDADHILLVSGGAGQAFLVHAVRVDDTTITCERAGAVGVTGYRDVTLTFPSKNKANQFWAALDAAMVT